MNQCWQSRWLSSSNCKMVKLVVWWHPTWTAEMCHRPFGLALHSLFTQLYKGKGSRSDCANYQPNYNYTAVCYWESLCPWTPCPYSTTLGKDLQTRTIWIYCWQINCRCHSHPVPTSIKSSGIQQATKRGISQHQVCLWVSRPSCALWKPFWAKSESDYQLKLTAELQAINRAAN